MATLELKDCKEMVMFKLMTEKESFLEACREVAAFDKSHPGKEILKNGVNKEILQICFAECRAAMAIAFPRGETPDFGNLSHLNRLKNVFNQQQPKRCRKSYDNFTSVFRGKIGMGGIFLEHMDYIGQAGTKYYKSVISEEKRDAETAKREQVTVDSYRRLGKSYGSKQVFSDKPRGAFCPRIWRAQLICGVINKKSFAIQ